VFLFSRFIVRQVVREPVKTLLTVLGVALGVAVVVAIRMANDSSLRGFSTALEAMAGKTSVEIVGTGVGLDETQLPQLTWLAEYGEVSPVIAGDGLIAVGSHSDAPGIRPQPDLKPPARPPGTAVVDTPAAARAGTGLVRVLGIDILRDQPFREYRLVRFGGESGREPTTEEFLDLLTDPSSVIVTEKLATRLGLREGDPLPITLGDREVPFVVRGVLRNEGPARTLDGNLVLMDIATAQWRLGRLGRIDRLDVRLHDPSTIDRAEREIASRLLAGLTAQRPARRGAQVERMLAAFHLNLTALSLVALLVGLFLVYNTVSVSVVSRREEIGTLRAVGTTRGAILFLFLGEAAAFALAGTALGLVLGRALAWGAIELTSATVNTMWVAMAAAPPRVTWADVWVAAGMAIPLSLAAAAFPAAEAARVTPMAAIRGADRLETRFSLGWRRLAIPAVLIALGAWLATRPPIAGMPLGGFGAALAFVFAAASLVPLALFLLGRVGRLVMERLFGVEGFLANGNLAGAIPRLSVSVAALAIGLSMMVAIAIMIGSFRETVVYWVGQTLQADLFVGPAARGGGARDTSLTPDVERAVRTHPAVESVDAFRTTTVTVNELPVAVNSGDLDVVVTRGRLLFKAPSDPATAVRAAIGRDEVIASESFTLKHGRRVGDTIALPTLAGPRPFRIAAVFFDYSNDRGVLLLDTRTFARHFGELRPAGLALYLRRGSSGDEVRAQLAASLPPGSRLYIYTNAGLRAEVLRIFDATFAITYALELIAIFVAIMGVAGTLLTLVIERRKELAVLRLIGAERAQVRRMVVLEGAMLGAVSQAIGLGVGVLLSLVLVYVVNVQSFGWTIQFHLPWMFLGQMSLLVLAATALSGLYPAYRASRMHAAEQVAEE
jgi:putative ABC transport system permease protein